MPSHIRPPRPEPARAPPEDINEFQCPDGLLNEFKMFWHLRHRFPLHFLVFKQIACRGADDGKLF